MKNTFKTIPLIFILTFWISVESFSQSKKPLNHSVYDGWKNIERARISNNGNFISFEVNPQKGDGHLKLVNTKEDIFSEFVRGENAVFSPNSNFIVYRIKPQFDTVRAKKLDGVKKDQLPKDSVGIVVFDSKKEIKYPGLSDFKVPEKSSDWVAILTEDLPVKKSENDSTEKNDSKKDKRTCGKGKTLLILNPVSGDSVSYKQVCKLAISKYGAAFAFI